LARSLPSYNFEFAVFPTIISLIIWLTIYTRRFEITTTCKSVRFKLLYFYIDYNCLWTTL